MSNQVINLGIDLGTSFSLVAKLDALGNPQIIKGDSHMRSSLPSVVSFQASEPEIGESARMTREAQNTFSMFKRNMGLTKEAVEVNNEGVYPYEVNKESNGIKTEVYSPVELSAMILTKLREWVEMEQPPVDIGSVVVTVPAHFGDSARRATEAAAEKAGLHNIKLISEPTAAAIYCSVMIQNELPKGVFAVYDIGGGTFDVTIFRTDGVNEIEEVVTLGDQNLGGEDFDRQLRELVKIKYYEITGEEITNEDVSLDMVERGKIRLCSDAEEWVTRVLRENITVTRSEFEQEINIAIAQTGVLCQTVLDEAREKFDITNIDQVILAGGSSRIPLVKKLVQQVFHQEPVILGNVDEIVAMGAVIYATISGDKSLLNEAQAMKFNHLKVLLRTGSTFGTVIWDDESEFEGQLIVTPVIERGSRIPAQESIETRTRLDGQKVIQIQITESLTGETNPKWVEIIAKGVLELPPPHGPPGRKIKTTFVYDENQIMDCEVKDIQSGVLWSEHVAVGRHSDLKDEV